jgi:hypothetical protein
MLPISLSCALNGVPAGIVAPRHVTVMFEAGALNVSSKSFG